MRLALIGLCAFATFVSSQKIPRGFNSSICELQPINTTSPDYKPFPNIPNEFWSIAEWNDLRMRKSYKLEEYYSQVNDIGTIFVTGYMGDGITSAFITSGLTDEIFIIYDTEPEQFSEGNCVVGSMSDVQEWTLPFKKKGSADILLSGRALLNLGGTVVGYPYFAGNDYVNGVYCDIFTACVWVEVGKVTIKVQYAFSHNGTGFNDKSWVSPGSLSSTIINVKATGKAHNEKDISIKQAFNYVYMSDEWPSKTAKFLAKKFETPDHTYCPGRKNVYGLPKVPSAFSLRVEIIDHLENTVQITKEFYDFYANMSRIDFKDPPTGNNTIDATVSPHTIISDYNDGITYVMDKYSGECVVVPAIGGDYASVEIGTTHARIRNPKEFFNFDNAQRYPYQYMGEHEARGIPCDSWISYRPFPNEQSEHNATWEWYFATRATVFKVKSYAEDLEPIKCSVRSPETNVDVDYNIYRFSEEEPSGRAFDVSYCYRGLGSTSFELQLTGDWTSYSAEDHLDLLDYWFKLSVEAFSGVRAVRVQHTEYEFYADRIVARFTLLDKAPIKGDAINNNFKQIDLQTATDLLTNTIEKGNFVMYFMPDTTKQAMEFSAVPSSLRVIKRGQKHDATMESGLNSGQAAGLGIGMLLLGVVLAAVGVIVFRKKTSQGFAYKQESLTQHDETKE